MNLLVGGELLKLLAIASLTCCSVGTWRYHPRTKIVE